MAKKKGKIMKKTKKTPHKDLHHFTMLLKLTERCLENNSEEINNYFKTQADNLRTKIRGLK